MIKAENISVSFTEKRNGRKVTHTVLRDLSFEMKQGEILGLAGESGSGKSTLAKTLLGITELHSGEFTINDKSPQMVFQDPFSALNPAKTIRFILEEPLKISGVKDKEERLKKVKDSLLSVGLEEILLERKPAELSGGQRQRICIAAALMNDPGLLIADEPVSALDVTVQAQVLALLKKLKEERGFSILFISHDLRTMYNFCDRVMILKEGRIAEQGKVEELYRDPKDPYTKLLLESAGIRQS
ncbi:MAG: ATP-binding cassette domain-containing protein [Lachnospiraceae bacterium]|nr:ATP-binding cassette domain-containing protein [Lachnospiraceae bacterium]